MERMTMTSFYYLNGNEIKDICNDVKRRKATAIGTRSYYLKDRDGTTLFVSYWTDIARLDGSILKFECTDIDAYTRTTVKHLNVFISALGFGKTFGIADIRKMSAAGWQPIDLRETK